MIMGGKSDEVKGRIKEAAGALTDNDELRDELADDRFLDEAEWVVSQVDRVLGRPRGIRIGEEPDRDGQYYHYLAMWLFALWRFGQVRPKNQDRAIELARMIHPRFVIPDVGVQWKMRVDLSGPYGRSW
jgi:hypothetical protein